MYKPGNPARQSAAGERNRGDQPGILQDDGVIDSRHGGIACGSGWFVHSVYQRV